MDMKILFDDFTTYVESMSDEEIKESIQNATKNTSDCMEEEQWEFQKNLHLPKNKMGFRRIF